MSSNPETGVAPAVDGGPQRGKLKIYLGYASHTGKTWRLLDEARRRQARGQDVVIGWLRQKDRPALAHLVGSLEMIPGKDVGGQMEMDTEAILARAPHAVMIDELAHRNAPGSLRKERWQDVEVLLAAGINVVTALNIQYVEGLKDQVEEIVGKVPEESVPEEMVQDADEVAVVDASPDAVLTHPDPARPSQKQVLKLRELALYFAADTLEEDVQEALQSRAVSDVWETQERLLLCITSDGHTARVIKRGQEVAKRWHGELCAVHVARAIDEGHLSSDEKARQQALIAEAAALGVETEVVYDPDPAHGVLEYAKRRKITQIFLGHPAALTFPGALSRTVTGRILLDADGIDVHVVGHERRDESVPRDQVMSRTESLARLLSEPVRPEIRGHERIYLGYAPGVGKSYQMLLDGQYLRDHGQDVVVGLCDAHGRADVVSLIGSLEVVPPLDGQLDVDAVLRRRPQLCLIGDMAARAGANLRRYQQIGRLCDAGVHVFTTLEVSEIEGLRDTIAKITGTCTLDTVPDWRLDEADELVFVDCATRALLNRVSRGSVFRTPEVPEDMKQFFEPVSLNALRELAMRVTAERVDDDLEGLEKAGSQQKGQGHAILVCVHHRPEVASVLRRARRVADRLDVPCFAVFVAPDEDWTGSSDEDRRAVKANLELARGLHIETHELYGPDVARTLIDFAMRHRVAQVFVGRSRKKVWYEFFRRSIIEHIMRQATWLDVQVIARG